MNIDEEFYQQMAETAFIDEEPTWEIIKALMCFILHKLPSEIEGEGQEEITKLFYALKTYNNHQLNRPVEFRHHLFPVLSPFQFTNDLLLELQRITRIR